MKYHKTITMVLCAVGLTSLAHDGDTLAFYAFKEGSAGSSVADMTLLNSAGERFHGEVAIGVGTIEYSGDTPGAYVFASEIHGGAAVCEKPQSLRFSGNSMEGSQVVSFADLGTVVSSNDDFTVEFFFKYGEGDGGANKTVPMLSMNCGLHYNPSDSTKEGAGEPGLFGIMIHGSPDRYFDGYVVERNQHKARADANPSGNNSSYPQTGFADGLWHHAAVVYTKSQKKYTVYLDYGVQSVAVARETDKSVLENSEAMILGNGGFRGLVSCLRVSKCARDASSFLRCSGLASYSPKTLFHWSFDGGNGDPVAMLQSPLSSDPRTGQFIAKHAPRNGEGYVGTYIDASGNAASPVHTNEVPVRRRFAVESLSEQLCVSSNAIAVTAYGTDGNVLYGSGANCFPSASWTMEGWFMLDYENYRKNVVEVNSTNAHVALMALGAGSGSTIHDKSDAMVYLHHTSGEFKLKLNVTDANGTSYDCSGVSLGSVFRDAAWHHVALVYDESTLQSSVYVDGDLISSAEMSAPLRLYKSHDGRRFLVGSAHGMRKFYGLMDEVRVVQRALHPSEFICFGKVKLGLRITVR